MKQFLSCDWGTSTFRLRLVETSTMSVLAEEKNQQGILATHDSWQKKNYDEGQRISFYQKFIHEHIDKIGRKLNAELNDIPVVISGMASSRMGMIELPYKALPISTDGSDLELKYISAQQDFPHNMILISGLRTASDVLRGEETMLIGSVEDMNDEALFIFPGTHSKHILARNGSVIDLRSYMTGEFFELLSTKSILSNSIEAGGKLEEAPNLFAFENGVLMGLSENILHGSFLARTNDLFLKCSRQQNYYFLSGLLIGAELSDLQGGAASNITIVAGKEIRAFYLAALQASGLLTVVTVKDADEALIRGQLKVIARIKTSYTN